jgi:hypothetical protein
LALNRGSALGTKLRFLLRTHLKDASGMLRSGCEKAKHVEGKTLQLSPARGAPKKAQGVADAVGAALG